MYTAMYMATYMYMYGTMYLYMYVIELTAKPQEEDKKLLEVVR